MKYLIIIVSMWVASFAPTWADERRIQTTIQMQIDAFKEDDFVAAFEYASPTIQSIFKTSDRFGLMVRRGYPMVHRPAKIKFLEREPIANEVRQKVQSEADQGRLHVMA